MEKRPVIVWNNQALESFIKALKWIGQESILQAEKVEEAVVEKINELPDHPERYPLDKFKSNNPGNYRAFETHSYRIAYRHTTHQIRILRIRHVRQEPKEY